MPHLNLRNIDEPLKASLHIRAAENGRSIEEEANQIFKHFLLRKKCDAGVGTLISSRIPPAQAWICQKSRVTLSRNLPDNNPSYFNQVGDAQIVTDAITIILTLATRNIKDLNRLLTLFR